MFDKCYTYEVVGFRAPKRGEYYVSGSYPQAYKAPNDLEPSEYLIVKPLINYKQSSIPVWRPVT